MKTVYFDKDIPRILATKAAAGHAKKLLKTKINAVKYETGLPEPALPADDWVRMKNITCGLAGPMSASTRRRRARYPPWSRSPASARRFLAMKMSASSRRSAPA